MFDQIVDMNNLIQAYYLARKSKKYSKYVQKFEINREYNLWQLQQDLIQGKYKHGEYNSFEILDPKPRIIQVSPFRDRIVHQALYLVLNPVFEVDFIDDSYACRKGKGSQRAIKRFEYFWQKLSHKSKDFKKVYVLKADIVKYFDSIDHKILKIILYSKIRCEQTRQLLDQIIDSFRPLQAKGVPIGNLTSQLFSNIYLNELDQYMKYNIKADYYIRYMDDFVVMDYNINRLKYIQIAITKFLAKDLYLDLHHNKTHIHKLKQGITFLGYTLYLYSRKIKAKTYYIMRQKYRLYIQQKYYAQIDQGNLDRAISSWWGLMKFKRGIFTPTP